MTIWHAFGNGHSLTGPSGRQRRSIGFVLNRVRVLNRVWVIALRYGNFGLRNLKCLRGRGSNCLQIIQRGIRLQITQNIEYPSVAHSLSNGQRSESARVIPLKGDNISNLVNQRFTLETPACEIPLNFTEFAKAASPCAAGLQRVLERAKSRARRLHQNGHVARLVLVCAHQHV